MAKSFKKNRQPIPAPVKSPDYLEAHLSQVKEETKPAPTNTEPVKEEVTKQYIKQSKKLSKAKKKQDLVTATIRLSPDQLETLKDYVYMIKCTGRFDYTQSGAIAEGLVKLFGKTKIPKRPAEIIEQEIMHSQSIIDARKK